MITYLAGAYRGSNWLERQINIARAKSVAQQLWGMGKVVICPHTNSGNFDKYAPDKHFLDGYLEILRMCDEVLVLPDWQQSKGTVAEVEEALKWGIPVKEVAII